MKKIILYLFCFLFLPSVLVAQEPVILFLEGIRINTKIDGYYVEKVIDARKDKSNIGCIYNWIGTKKMPIVLDGEMEIVLKNILNADFEKKITDKALYIRLNDFLMRETDDEDIFISFIDVTFLEKTEDGVIELLTTSGMASSHKTIATRRKNNKENMEQAIEDCLFDFNFKKKRNVLLNKKISPDRLLEKDTFAVPNLDMYKKGIFHTFTDFQLNTPDTKIKWEPNYSYSTTKNQISAKISIDFDKPWGFCDGKNVYIKTLNNLYVPLKNKDNHLIFYDNSIYEEQYTKKYLYKKILTVELLGGFLGTLLAPVITGDTKRNAIEININNGLSSFYQGKMEADNEKLIYLTNAAAPKGKIINFSVNGQNICSLERSSFTAFYAPLGSNQNVCIQVENQEKVCQNTTINEGNTIIFQAKIEEGKPVNLELLTDAEKIKTTMQYIKEVSYNLVCPF